MTANGWFQITFFIGVILLVTKPTGVFITRVFGGAKTFNRSGILRPQLFPFAAVRSGNWV